MATWATSGSATDFTAADGPGPGEETMLRATAVVETTPRFAILGSTNYTDSEVGISLTMAAAIGAVKDSFVILRWTDSSNYAFLRHRPEIGATGGAGTGLAEVALGTVVAGVKTEFATATLAITQVPRLVIFASGRLLAIHATTGAMLLESRQSALATGGALATGKPGFADQSTDATPASRYYDAFYVAIPAPEPIVCYAGRSIEFRHDATERADATGTYWGQPPSYRGARFLVPPAGTRGRKTRVAVMAKRNNTTAAPDDTIADSLTVQVAYTPRYLNAPR